MQRNFTICVRSPRRSKSTKLAFAFDLFDTNGVGVISKRGIWKLLRSFLCGILSLSGATTQLSAEEVFSYLDGAATALSKSIMLQKSQVSFKNIADWYSVEGFRKAPWLELLDISKWNFFAHI